MKNNILVTVFMPMYNAQSYLKEAIDSVLNQSYTNIELLIINDGSTDKSVDIVSSYTDKRIRLLHNDLNKGLPYTRNRGITEARGDYIALMDSDDLCHQQRIEKQVKFLEYNRNVDVVGSNMKMFKFDESNTIEWNKIDIDTYRYISGERVKVLMLFHDPIPNSSAMIRKNSIIRNNIKYGDKFFVAQDYDFFSKLSLKCNICILEDVLLAYRTGHDNVTSRSKINKLEQRTRLIFEIKKNLFEFYKIDIDEKQLKLFEFFFGERMFNNIEKNIIFDIKSVLDCIINTNAEKKYFNQELLVDVINTRTLLAIRRSKLSLIKKISYYKILLLNNTYDIYIRDIKLIISDKKKYYKRRLKNILNKK